MLVANLGTPAAPTPAAVRKFLAEFLWDPRVIEVPRALWWLILHGVILRIRPARSARAYQEIWTEAGSPLMVHSRALADALQADLAQRLGVAPVVALGMTYGQPSIAAALAELRQQNVRRLLVLPLYPQYSATTTAAIFDRVTAELQRWRWLPELRFINNYHDDPGHITALCQSLRSHLQATPAPDHLLFSFHGLPRKNLTLGDPYYCQTQATARLVAAQLGLEQGRWSVSYQSRVGREPWLEPYTETRLPELAASGQRRIAVACPGFSVDCLETLEEIAIRNRADFIAAGGTSFDYVPCLNAGAGQVQSLGALIHRHCQGWVDTAQ